MSNELDALRTVGAKVMELDAERAGLAAERDEAVRAALAAGVSVVEITRATGLNRSRVYQIRDFRR